MLSRTSMAVAGTWPAPPRWCGAPARKLPRRRPLPQPGFARVDRCHSGLVGKVATGGRTDVREGRACGRRGAARRMPDVTLPLPRAPGRHRAGPGTSRACRRCPTSRRPASSGISASCRTGSGWCSACPDPRVDRVRVADRAPAAGLVRDPTVRRRRLGRGAATAVSARTVAVQHHHDGRAPGRGRLHGAAHAPVRAGEQRRVGPRLLPHEAGRTLDRAFGDQGYVKRATSAADGACQGR